MSKPVFEPGTSEVDVFTLETKEGRARLFKKRVDELMRPDANGKSLSLDDALFEMRTGGNPDDQALLEAMGEHVSHTRTEKLKDAKRVQELRTLGEKNANPLETSAEVKAAMARNQRAIAFNVRIDELTREGFTVDQAILQMRANKKDAALLAAMGAG